MWTSVHADEWYVDRVLRQHGRGDLVLRTPDGTADLVVEIKHITPSSSGRKGTTVRVSRIKRRKKVREQAMFYGQSWVERPDVAGWFRFTHGGRETYTSAMCRL